MSPPLPPSSARPPRSTGPLSTGSRRLSLLLAAAFLMLPAAWNGLPLMYPDTPTYLRGAESGLARALGNGRLPAWLGEAGAGTTAHEGAPATAAARAAGLSAPEEGVVLAGRSVYYGGLLEAAHLAGSLWWAVAVQALCLAWLLQLLLVQAWRLPDPAFVGVSAALALATPAGLFTGLLMPDIFAGIAILASALLMAQGRALRGAQVAGLCALLLFALCAHASHLATVALLLLTVMAGWFLGRRGPATVSTPGPWPLGLILVSACLAGAMGAEAAFSSAVTRALGSPPLRLPYLTARLVDRGPGTAYLRQACPGLAPPQRWAACDFIARYPLAWTDFLFEPDPARGVFGPADAATKRRLSQEQLPLAWAVLRADPAPVLGGMVLDAGRQLLMFRIDIWGLGPRELAMYAGRVPQDLLEAMRRSRGAQEPGWQARFSALTAAGVAASLVALAWLAARGRLAGPPALLAAWVLAGLLLNAALCASLAAPLDRFQARVVWLLPLLAAGLALRRAPASDRAPTARPDDAGRSAVAVATAPRGAAAEGSAP